MNVKIGDKVRFLNSVGGGTVKCFQGKDTLLVEDGDGFEIPVLLREVVVVESLSSQVYTKPKSQDPVEILKPPPEPEPQNITIEETPEGERLSAFLAFLPVEPKNFQQSNYETYFINESNYFLFFNYMNRQHNSWISRYSGLIEPNTKIFLEEFEKKDLNGLERVCVQFIAFKKDKPYSLKNSVSIELHIDIVKFYKIHCFKDNDFFNEDALIFPVIRNDVPERELLISSTDLQEAIQQKVRIDQPRRKSLPEKVTSPILEIDLHINQLLDNTNGMSSADMLNYQVSKFHEILQQYAGHKGQKIIFIHGKGDGVLRSSIEKELKTRYKQYYYQDASFREYGFGATLVIIK